MIKITRFMSFVAMGLLFFSSCVPTSKFNASQQALSSARYDSAQLAGKVKDLQSQLAQANQLAADRQKQIDSLNQELADTQNQIATLNKQLGDLRDKNKDLTTESANRLA